MFPNSQATSSWTTVLIGFRLKCAETCPVDIPVMDCYQLGKPDMLITHNNWFICLMLFVGALQTSIASVWVLYQALLGLSTPTTTDVGWVQRPLWAGRQKWVQIIGFIASGNRKEMQSEEGMSLKRGPKNVGRTVNKLVVPKYEPTRCVTGMI